MAQHQLQKISTEHNEHPKEEEKLDNDAPKLPIHTFITQILRTLIKNQNPTLQIDQAIRDICSQVTIQDFHLPEFSSSMTDYHHQEPKYYHIWEDDNVSIGIFSLPPGGTIPLHDHPEMTVISKILYGSVVVNTGDLIKNTTETQPIQLPPCDQGYTWWKRKGSFQASAGTILSFLPHCCNLHELLADPSMGCVFLDVITPPYNTSRPCTYFKPTPTNLTSVSSENIHLLQTFKDTDPIGTIALSTIHYQ